MLHRSLAAAAAVLLGLCLLPAGAAAIPVDFFHSPSDDGSHGGILQLAPGTNTINLWADPSGAAGGGTFGVQDVLVQVTVPGISVVSFACDAASCIPGMPGSPSSQALFTAGDDINGDFAPFEIGTLVVDVQGAGSIAVVQGTALAASFVGGNLDVPEVIAATPEPGAWALLGSALAGLALRRRART